MPSPILELGIPRGPHEAPFGGTGGSGGGSLVITRDRPLEGKLAVITGTSRGIGAGIAEQLAAAGADIKGSHVDQNKERKQGKTAEIVRQYGVSFDSVVADITDPEGRKALATDAIGDPENPRGVDILVLNAAGGLESEKSEDWAEQINVHSQNALIDEFLPHMNPGSHIIFMTSLWAHDYGNRVQLPRYGAVAWSKNMFERQFRERGRNDLADRNIHAGVVVGHVISGTAAHTLFMRGAKQEMAKLEPMAEGGKFADTLQMGAAVRQMIFDRSDTTYVGGTNADMIDLPDEVMDRDAVSGVLNMYSQSRLLVDTFERVNVGVGEGTYTVRKRDTQGHFTGRRNKRYKDIQIWKGQEQGESLAQTAGLTFRYTEGDMGGVVVLRGTEVWNDGMVFTGNRTTMHTELIRRTRDSAIFSGEMRVGDKIVSTAPRIELYVIPSVDQAERIVSQARAERDEAMAIINNANPSVAL